MEVFKHLFRVQRNGGAQKQSLVWRILEFLPLHQRVKSAPNAKNWNEGLERGVGVIKC